LKNFTQETSSNKNNKQDSRNILGRWWELHTNSQRSSELVWFPSYSETRVCSLETISCNEMWYYFY